MSKKNLIAAAIAAIAAIALSSSAFAFEAPAAVSNDATVGISMGGGFDVYNQTNNTISFKVNGLPFGGSSPAGKYGTLPASWTILRAMCLGKTVCPAVINWGTYSINTSINTQTGFIGGDSSLDPSLPSLNATLAAAGIPIKATLSNENGATSGIPSRNGWELVTITAK